jgi:hypothetical protein
MRSDHGRWASAGSQCRRRYRDDGQPAGYLGRGAFARRLAAAFLLPAAARQKNSVTRRLLDSARWCRVPGLGSAAWCLHG